MSPPVPFEHIVAPEASRKEKKMIRRGVLILVFMGVLQGPAFGQGFLDSVMGPGGFGLWGSGPAQQFDTTQAAGQQMDQSGQYTQQQVGPGQYAQAPAGYPQQGYAQPAQPYQGGYPPAQTYQYQYPPSQGMYPEWQNYAPGAQQPGPPAQYGAEAPAQYGAQPPVQYVAPAQTAQQQGAPPLRPGQYAPGQQPPPVSENEVELPAGAVRITTTSPDGTTVQYYPPPGAPVPEQAVAPPGPAPAQPRRATTRKQPPRQQAAPPREQAAPRSRAAVGSASVAMPQPVDIPRGYDPRMGWGAPAAQ